jgi:hypothetical protein
MLVALIAPELIAGIAIKERIAAKKYMDEWNANFLSLCKRASRYLSLLER